MIIFIKISFIPVFTVTTFKPTASSRGYSEILQFNLLNNNNPLNTLPALISSKQPITLHFVGCKQTKLAIGGVKKWQ